MNKLSSVRLLRFVTRDPQLEFRTSDDPAIRPESVPACEQYLLAESHTSVIRVVSDHYGEGCPLGGDVEIRHGRHTV